VVALREQIKYVVLKLLQLQDLGIMALAVIVVKQLHLQLYLLQAVTTLGNQLQLEHIHLIMGLAVMQDNKSTLVGTTAHAHMQDKLYQLEQVILVAVKHVQV
jgi:hypothetical protein